MNEITANHPKYHPKYPPKYHLKYIYFIDYNFQSKVGITDRPDYHLRKKEHDSTFNEEGNLRLVIDCSNNKLFETHILDKFKDCKKFGLKGVVLKSKKNIFLDRNKCISFANKNKIFIKVI